MTERWQQTGARHPLHRATLPFLSLLANPVKRVLVAVLTLLPSIAGAQSLQARAAAMDSAARSSTGALFDFPVERPAKLAGRRLEPRYPDALKAAGVGGMVMVRFEVDTLGAVDLATFRVLRAPHPELAASVREALASARYVPARNEGRLVRQVVMQRFDFAPRR